MFTHEYAFKGADSLRLGIDFSKTKNSLNKCGICHE